MPYPIKRFIFARMEFIINLVHDRKKYKYLVEYNQVDKKFEHFIVKAANKTLVVQSNRPLYKSKGLRHRKPDFKLIRGQVSNIYFLRLIYDAIQEFIDKNGEALH